MHTTRSVCSALLVLTAAWPACGGAEPAPTAAPADDHVADAEPDLAPRRLELDLALDGLSGLTIDERGVLWAVAERSLKLAAFQSGAVLGVVPLEGFPEDADAESIAYLGEGRFAIGTESVDEERASDHVHLVTLEGRLPEATARVTGQVELPYSVLSVSPARNKGIEGLCAVGDTVIAAVEPKLMREDGTCTTALARGELSDTRWTGHDVELTTETGKISALACRAGPAGIEVFAIERHYEVMRVLRFVVPDAPGDAPIVPEVVVDLAGALEGDPNLEGLALDGADFVMINDNHYGERTGPNEEFRVARTE